MLKRVIKKYVKMGGCQHLRDFRAAERLKTAILRKRIMERNKKHPEERQCSIQSNVPNIVHFFHLTFFKSYSPAPASRKKKRMYINDSLEEKIYLIYEGMAQLHPQQLEPGLIFFFEWGLGWVSSAVFKIKDRFAFDTSTLFKNYIVSSISLVCMRETILIRVTIFTMTCL